MRALIFTNPCPFNVRDIVTLEDYHYYVGVDGACIDMMNQEIIINLAIGDFDSFPSNQISGLKDYANELVALKPEKDITDTAAAISYLHARNVKDITIVGGIKGNRPEHLIANTNILKKNPGLRIMDRDTIMFTLKPGKYKFEDNSKFYSFFAVNKVEGLTLEGFKYDLENYTLDTDDSLCISNERDDLYTTIKFNKGHILVIMTDKDA